MSNPNIVNVSTITAKSVGNTPSTTTETEFIVNSANSGKVLKINQVVAANIDGTNAVGATVSLCTNAAAPSSSNTYQIAPNISVPAKASLICIDKNSSIYLEENMSIRITAGTASKISFTASYEEIS